MLDAAKAMKLSAKDLLKLRVIEEIITEPLGGAHRDRNLMLQNVRESISKNLEYFENLSPEEILDERKSKFLKIGRSDGFVNTTEDSNSLTIKSNKFISILKSKKIITLTVIFAFLLAILVILFS